MLINVAPAHAQTPIGPSLFDPPGSQAPLIAKQSPPHGSDSVDVCGPLPGSAFSPPPGPGFLRSLGRYGPPPPPMGAGIGSAHVAPWDAPPTASGALNETAPSLFGPAPSVDACAPNIAAPPPCDANQTPYAATDFGPDPYLDGCEWDGCSDPYAGKHLNCAQRPWVECPIPLYGPGPWPESFDFLGPTNLVQPKFYVYGDFRTAIANNNFNGNTKTVWGNRLNLDFDFAITATERVHAFLGPLDQGQQFSGFAIEDGNLEVEDRFDGFDESTDALYFEGDLGYIFGGLAGIDAPFDLPVAVGLIPLVLQNGVWLEDSFVGAAATIPARNSPALDWSNFDVTFFVGFEELNNDAFGAESDEADFVGVTTFIERRGGYIELGWAYVDDPTGADQGYHNIGMSYTRRYLNLVSNSARVIVNTGQGGPESDRTADGALFLLENSLLTPLPYNVIPYVNLFAGFDRPQPLGRLQGPLKNTGINFESDLLTGYPFLDDSGNDTYGGAFGVDLLGADFDRQFIIEAAVLQAYDDPVGRVAPGDQYALGVRWQRRLNNSLILRADAMHGWLENAADIDGARVELRHKF